MTSIQNAAGGGHDQGRDGNENCSGGQEPLENQPRHSNAADNGATDSGAADKGAADKGAADKGAADKGAAGVSAEVPRDHLLGWDDGFGHHMGFAANVRPTPILMPEPGHRLTVGPTGSGKAVSGSMVELLSYRGNAVVLDIKSELYEVTARFRRDVLGQQIILFDPFNLTGEQTVKDSLNPIDLAPLLGPSLYEAATMIATLFTGIAQRTSHSRNSNNDHFWEDQATQLLIGMVGAAMERKLGESNSFPAIRSMLKSDDAVYNLAVLLDVSAPSRLFKEEIAAFLQTTDVTRSGILSTLHASFRGIAGEGIEHLLSSTSFDLADFVHGRLPATIYIVIPPEQLLAQQKLIRLLLGTILNALYTRRYIPDTKTLVQIDEAASLGQFEAIRTGITLFRGVGVELSVYVQDIDQLFNLYSDARTLINNMAVVRVLKANNYWQANMFADLFGVQPRTVSELGPDEQLLVIDGVARRCRRVNYLTDPEFAGRFDPNPRHPRRSNLRRPGQDDQLRR
jgi:type IV secretion system protein VirD4